MKHAPKKDRNDRVLSVDEKNSSTSKPTIPVNRFTAKQLNALSDISAPMPDDIQDWESAAIVGSEVL